MVIKSIGPLSCAKIAGTLYGIIGLVLGAIVSLVALVSVGAGIAGDHPQADIFGAVFGVAAVIVLPLLYGGLGFVMTAILASLYNVVAGWVGGIEVELQ